MTTKPSPEHDGIPLPGIPETPDERAARHRPEATPSAQGEADFTAEGDHNHDEVEAWLEQFETAPATPLPA